MISWGETAHRIRCGCLWFELNNLPAYYWCLTSVVLFLPEAWQSPFLLQFHLHLKSHLSYHSLSHPWILTLRAALQRECLPQEVSWLNAVTNYYSYLKAVAAVFNFTVSSYSVLLKCQHSPAAIVHGSPVNMFSSLGGENRCFCLQKMLQALAAGDGQQAVRSNLYGQAGLSQRDVFTEHEMNVFAQRQIIAYNGDFSSRFAAWMIISKVSWSTHSVHLLSKVIQDFLAVLLSWKVLRYCNVHAVILSLLIETCDRLCCYICICSIVSKSFLNIKLFFDWQRGREEGTLSAH